MSTTEAAKPGWKTSEFWLSVLTAVGGLAATAWQHTPWGAVIAGVTSAGYSIARGIAKGAQ